VSFQINDAPAPADLVQQLGCEGIWIRDLADPSCLRACTHICTSDEEIDQLATAISTIS
jgi:L-cysteine/cystine lyase